MEKTASFRAVINIISFKNIDSKCNPLHFRRFLDSSYLRGILMNVDHALLQRHALIIQKQKSPLVRAGSPSQPFEIGLQGRLAAVQERQTGVRIAPACFD